MAGIPDQKPFLYGTHYSAPGYVLYYLVRQGTALFLPLSPFPFDPSSSSPLKPPSSPPLSPPFLCTQPSSPSFHFLLGCPFLPFFRVLLQTEIFAYTLTFVIIAVHPASPILPHPLFFPYLSCLLIVWNKKHLSIC